MTRHKPVDIEITDNQWKQICDLTYNNILKKLDSAKFLINNDSEIAAGLYTYALEEFGKLLLLGPCAVTNGKHTVPYRDRFVYHEYKFEIAFDYLQENKADHCIILNEGDFSPENYSWRNFFIGLPANFESRKSIFHSDFIFEQDKVVVGVKSVPKVDSDYLERAVSGLIEVMDNLNKIW